MDRDRHDQRPWHQRNDYLGWICRAKREETKSKRLNQMLEELRAGDVYMKMVWNPKSGSRNHD
ncbi:YdeI/OmpD-associated family protein [uncultured Tateyamaria sp.]|uniref:YdeI/OmpD-associated family protein n=1 Tax=uncultured Tateyamaria sp. TaxID=455651 RepID=UPI00345B568E